MTPDMQRLTAHFFLEEFIHSSTADEREIDNSPTLDIIANLTVTANGLEKVRELLGNQALRISSGYRCPELNKAVRGAKSSAHMDGYAADFTCSQFGSPVKVVEVIAASDLAFDKVICEGTWTHISFDPAARRQTMTAHFDAQGKATYTKGVPQ